MSTLTTWRTRIPSVTDAPEAAAEAERPAVVLIVEDDQDVAAVLAAALAPGGHEIRRAGGAADALRAVEEQRPDVILLDLGLPDSDGLVLLHSLKARTGAPVLVCSARPRDPNAVLSLRLGADDFISKPFLVDELAERVEGVLRRAARRARASADGAESAASESAPAPLRLGSLAIDRARCAMTLADIPLPLTPTEYRLMETLALRHGTTVPREELGNQIWGGYDAAIGKAIDVHVTRLRRKLAAVRAQQGVAVVAVRGFGFMLETI